MSSTKISSRPKTITTTSTFSPTSITGCQLWLDAADSSTITLSGSKVTQWNDKSGNGYNFTQSTSGNQPTYSTSSQNNQNTITFTSANSTYLVGTASTNFIGTNSLSMYGVFKTNDATSGSSVFAKSLYGGASGRILYGYRDPGTPGTIVFANSGGIAHDIPDTYTAGAWRAAGFVSDRSGWTNITYQNGTITATKTIAADTTTNLTTGFPMLVGAYNNSSGGLPPQADRYLDGAVGELLLFSTALTTTQRQQVEGYLAQKWGLTASLPAGHPGLTSVFYGTMTVIAPTTITVSGSFVPTSIAGCGIWLDSSDSASLTFSSGSNISQWRDKSGSSNHFTPSSGTPTYISDAGKNVVNFPSGAIMSSANQITFSSINLSAFFIVSKLTGFGSWGAMLLGFTNVNGGDYSIRFYDYILLGTQAATDSGGSLGSATYYVNGTFNPNFGSNIYFNKYTIINTVAPGTSGTSYLTLSSAFMGRTFVGTIAEFICYPGGVTSNQRLTIEAYLAQKWGLTSNLPAGHTGLTTPLFGTISVTLPKQKVANIPQTLITSGSFLPTSIAGCGIWLDAADSTSFTFSTGSLNISQWRDKSGSSNHFNLTSGTTRYITDAGKDVVYFLSGGIMTSANQITFTTSSAFFIVSKLTGLGDWATLLAFTNINGSDYSIRLYTYILLGTQAYTDGGGSMGTTNYYVNGTFNPNFGSNVYLNNYTIIDTVAPSTSGTSFLTLSSSFMGRSFVGNMAEFIYYPGGVTSNQRQTIEGYLAQKWGLTSNLVAGHPGLTTLIYGTQISPVPTTFTATFSPTSIAGCQLWLDAADSSTITLSGSKVTQWNDKSGNGYNFTQSTSGNQPTYSTSSQNNQNTITFTSANSTYLVGTASTNFIGTNSLSMYGVFKTNNSTSGSSVFAKSLYGGASGRILYGYRDPGTPGPIDFANSGGITHDVPDTYTAGAWRAAGFVSDRSGWTNITYQNGTITATKTIAPDTTTNLTNAFPMLVGAYNNSTGGANPPQADRYLDGAVGELLLFSTALTTTQRQQVESYLAQKWGLTALLPVGHPGLVTTLYGSIPLPKQKIRSIPPPPLIEYVTTLTYTGSLRTFVVPAGVTSVRLYMWGAGGGTSSPVGGFVNYSGGAGAMVQGVYTVTPGSTLYVVVGKGGVTSQSTQSDAQGGGGGANSAGGGGGRSAIQLTAGGADVVVAGGGGGAGLLASNNNGTGGPAHFSGSSPNTLSAVVGYGGTQTAGGAAGGNGNVPGNPGTLKFGGAGTGPGAGGGGGYYGGGGMGNGDYGWGPGGGGSSLINNLSLIPGQSVFGFNSPNLSGAPNTSSPYYQSNIAAGGIGENATGGNGLVVIVYYI